MGTGFGALIHLPGYLLHESYNVVGIYGPSFEKTTGIAKEYGIRAYGSYDEVINDTEVELVSIASIPGEHFMMAEKAILNDKHVILEKPMAMNTEQSSALLKLALLKNVYHAIVHEHRFDPSKQFARHLLKEKTYGDLKSIEIVKHMTYWKDSSSGRGYDWFADRERGGGMIGAHLSHQVDFLNFIEDGYIRYLGGRAYTEVKKRLSQADGVLREHTSEDTVFAIAETFSGVPAFINISASRPKDVNHIRLFTTQAEITISGQNDIRITDNCGKVLCDKVAEEFCIKDYGSDFRLNTFVEFLERFYENYVMDIPRDISTFKDGNFIQSMLEGIEYVSA